jgi:hypothetical protein
MGIFRVIFKYNNNKNMSIAIDELMDLLFEAELDTDKRNKVLELAKELEEEKKAERAENKLPKSKNQLVAVLKIPNAIASEAISDDNSAAHVFQIPEDSDPDELIPNILEAAKEHNEVTKKKKNRVESFDDVTHIKRKFLKDRNIMLKTRGDWARVIILPEDLDFGGSEF